jgi:hypothetical protein
MRKIKSHFKNKDVLMVFLKYKLHAVFPQVSFKLYNEHHHLKMKGRKHVIFRKYYLRQCKTSLTKDIEKFSSGGIFFFIVITS